VLHKAVNKKKSRRLRWIGRAAWIEEPLNPCGVLARKPEGKGELGCSRHRGQRIILKCIYET
jgi:hypothetical protein